VAQAGIGNVAAGSAFAAAQSIAMGGAVPTVVSAVGAVLGGGMGTAAASVNLRSKDPRNESPAGEGAAGEDAVDEGGTSADAGKGAVHTGRNRCLKCRLKRERDCWHR
jgi:hypothetical protein